jgi:HAD superfamily phosphatase (TIGR01668 family)
MKHITNPSWLYPNFVATSVLDIDASSLLAVGITHLIFDLDRTLVPRRTDALPPNYRAHIRTLQEAGLTILIGTNSRRDTAALAKLLNVTVVRPHRFSMKPRRSFYARLVAQADTTPEHIAMAGDHIINDVIGPNRAGFTSILVTALTHRPTLIQQHYIRFVRRPQTSGGE